MAPLLPFHKSILERIHDPLTSDLVILARGLGLRRTICTLMKIYDSPKNLVLLVNASQEEEAAMGEELGQMGCRNPGLRVVGYEMGKKDRQDLYKRGGIMSVTSRILVVDMLQSDIPVDLITGIIVLHAEKVTALSLEAFIVRLYREKNRAGFLKAFSDQPEHITSGLSPLKAIMKELHLRTVHIYPRFHEEIKKSLERRRADVIELYQPMTEAMGEIHGAVVMCMSSTLSELKRSNATLDLDDFNVENTYFRSFDAIVRRQLDPVWHKVGPQTKQLVADLATLRRLLIYLLTYDPLAFHAYCETIIASNTVTASGGIKQHQSPWLLTDAAHIIFKTAKARCYTTSPTSNPKAQAGKGKSKEVIDVDDDDAWEALNDIQGTAKGNVDAKEQAGKPRRQTWMPADMNAVLEELPKWSLLADVLLEIEDEILRPLRPNSSTVPSGSNTVLIMSSSTRTSTLLSDFLSSMDTAPSAVPGTQGRAMMERKLRLYLWWKGKLGDWRKEGRGVFGMPDKSREALGGAATGVSEAMRRKDAAVKERGGSRRRVRGGAGGGAAGSGSGSAGGRKERDTVVGEGEMREEAETIAEFLATQPASAADAFFAPDNSSHTDTTSFIDLTSLDFGEEFDANYGLLTPEQTVVVRAYSDDSDDLILAELQPRFIVMFEPNQDFVRRVEVYRSSNPGLGVRVYFMVYQNSCEEHKYLAGIRREKESFERLIKERGSMLLPIYEDRTAGASIGDAIIKTISSRIGGGQKKLNNEPSQVIVDMREFRSTLPSLLHASQLLVIPATLTVGDYIITPDICVERKSIPDLIQSFNSGRLYTQCEWMSVHYKQPVLLIEFEEHKSFSLETFAEVKNYAKANSKYPPKKPTGPSEYERQSPTMQHKLVLLTLSFPRLRIIWSSSPFASAEIFNDLKLNNPEPDPSQAIAIGAEEDPDVGAGVNAAAEELLRSLPGVTAKNVKYVMSKVGCVRELCEMNREGVQGILGVEPGNACWEFMHRGENRTR